MADTMLGSGNNNYTNNTGFSQRIYGEGGNDTIYGGNYTAPVLFPGSNPSADGDWIYGGSGNDLYYGNSGNDVLVESESDVNKDSMYENGSEKLGHGSGGMELLRAA